VIKVPANAIYFKMIIRNLKETPWQLIRSMPTHIMLT